MAAYLECTGRAGVAEAAHKFKDLLTPDDKAPYDEVRYNEGLYILWLGRR